MAYPLNSRHFIQQLQKHPMQTKVNVIVVLDQLHKPRKRSFNIHHLESFLVIPSIKQEEVRNEVQRIPFVLLIV
jgi:hypothetical protein